jgi:hypothetical protein
MNIDFNIILGALGGLVTLILPTIPSIIESFKEKKYDKIQKIILPIIINESAKLAKTNIENDEKRRWLVELIDNLVKSRFNIDLPDAIIDRIVVIAYHQFVKPNIKSAQDVEKEAIVR